MWAAFLHPCLRVRPIATTNQARAVGSSGMGLEALPHPPPPGVPRACGEHAPYGVHEVMMKSLYPAMRSTMSRSPSASKSARRT